MSREAHVLSMSREAHVLSMSREAHVLVSCDCVPENEYMCERVRVCTCDTLNCHICAL